MSGLIDKVALVTGAASGMGRTHCERFADEGADVIALDISASANELRDTATQVEKHGRRCVTGLADVADLDALQSDPRHRLLAHAAIIEIQAVRRLPDHDDPPHGEILAA